MYDDFRPVHVGIISWYMADAVTFTVQKRRCIVISVDPSHVRQYCGRSDAVPHHTPDLEQASIIHHREVAGGWTVILYVCFHHHWT